MQDIDVVCELVNDLCGIYWDESKAYLIESRLSSLVEKHDCGSHTELVKKVRCNLVPGLKEEIIDAVTTNETLWFRDNSPFEALRYKILPELIDAKANGIASKRIRVWSAACSSGQEAYSIAMEIVETVPQVDTWDVQILGTDIAPKVVEQAKRGVFNHLEIERGMKNDYLRKYFVQTDDGWQVQDRIRAMCRFQTRNLHDPFASLGPFDITFCRNVAIYFPEEMRRSLFERLANVLTSEGWLFAGSSESLLDLGRQWHPQQHCRANCYRPNMAMATC